jgi:hypothetical protein
MKKIKEILINSNTANYTFECTLIEVKKKSINNRSHITNRDRSTLSIELILKLLKFRSSQMKSEANDSHLVLSNPIMRAN